MGDEAVAASSSCV